MSGSSNCQWATHPCHLPDHRSPLRPFLPICQQTNTPFFRPASSRVVYPPYCVINGNQSFAVLDPARGGRFFLYGRIMNLAIPSPTSFYSPLLFWPYSIRSVPSFLRSSNRLQLTTWPPIFQPFLFPTRTVSRWIE